MLFNKDASETGINVSNSFSFASFLKIGWPFLAGGAILGLLFAAFILTKLPTEFETTMAIQLGRVGGPAALVESPFQTITRINLPGFKSELSTKLGNRATLGKISTSLIKNTDLISISARGSTPEQSLLIAQVLFKQLQDRHHALAQPLIMNLQRQLDLLKQQAAESSKRRNVLIALPKSLQKTPSNETSLLTLPLALVQQDSDNMQREAAIIAQENLMKEPSTQPTKLIEATSVTKVDNTNRILLWGAFGGGMLGFLVAFIKMRSKYTT